MAHLLKLGTFKKHENSTAQPVTTSWAEFSITLKEGADLTSPVITIAADITDILSYNYATLLGRYYFIRAKNMLRSGYSVLSLDLDLLATFKSDIGGTSMYVTRSSAASDGNIVDNFYPTTGEIKHFKSADVNWNSSSVDYANGFFIVNVFGTSTAGTSTLWKLSPANFKLLINDLYTQLNGFQPADVESAIMKLIDGSPEKLVSSAMWFPSYCNFNAGALENVKVGGWISTAQGQVIINPVSAYNVSSLVIPKHPQAATRGDFLNLSPFSTYELHVPCFGSVNIDTTAIYNNNVLQVAIRYDALSGQGNAYANISFEDGGTWYQKTIARLTAQIGVTIPLHGQSNGASVVTGAVNTIGHAITGALAGNVAGAIIGGITGAIGTSMTALTGASCSLGSGGMAMLDNRATAIESTHLYICDEDNANNGRLYCKIASPSSLTGYMIVQKGLVEISGTEDEENRLNRMLESGFYYE